MLSKRCCRSGQKHPGSEAMRWKGKADAAPGFPACRLHNRCPCATWEAFNVANNTERLASFQKWVAALIKKGSCFSPPSPCAFRRHTQLPPREQMSRLCLCCQGNQSVLSSRIGKPGPGLSSAFCPLLLTGPAISSPPGTLKALSQNR
uniref:Uncharacterized protein n=1 Tax=Pipistrellus kuhlii TaxID=59472 RepID=A0A7J7VUS6_PIPKU|nr:hypothetical protein mPipKuh1_008294 [Pipistrellus kuhlii]